MPALIAPASVSVTCLRVACLLGLVGALAGCQSDYAADIVNQTPQPVFAQIFSNTGSGPVLGANRRLGPGDRASIGPVRNQTDNGAFLSVDSLPNPSRPVMVDLKPGTNFFVIMQDGTETAGPLRIVPKQ